jgi:hypothetical protein
VGTSHDDQLIIALLLEEGAKAPMEVYIKPVGRDKDLTKRLKIIEALLPNNLNFIVC